MQDKTENPELRECPLCGSAVKIADSHKRKFWIECPECDIMLTAESELAVVRRWNRRQGENIVKAEALEKMANNLDAKFATQKLEFTTMGWAIAELRQQAAALRAENGKGVSE